VAAGVVRWGGVVGGLGPLKPRRKDTRKKLKCWWMTIVLIIVKGFKERRTSIAFVWPSGFRVAAGRGVDFIIGEQVEVVAQQRCGGGAPIW
jgi:hypothetical protein